MARNHIQSGGRPSAVITKGTDRQALLSFSMVRFRVVNNRLLTVYTFIDGICHPQFDHNLGICSVVTAPGVPRPWANPPRWFSPVHVVETVKISAAEETRRRSGGDVSSSTFFTDYRRNFTKNALTDFHLPCTCRVFTSTSLSACCPSQPQCHPL